MLEQYVSGLLAAHLGKYVRGLSDQQLRVSLWNGRLDLHDLELRPSALEPLSLPIVVHRGFVGSLQITIPWTRLQSEPVLIEIDRIFLLVRPRKGAPWDPQAEQEQEQARKQHQLAVWEAERRDREARAAATASTAPGAAAEAELGRAHSFMKRIGELIINNIQISVRSVHLRYEDADTDPHNPIALGATFGAASCVSTDADWNPRFVTESTGHAHKLLSLAQWSAYLAPCPAEQMLTRSHPPAAHCGEAARQRQVTDPLWGEMERLMAAAKSHTIAGPGDAHLRLRLQQGQLRIDDPRVTATVECGTMLFRLAKAQYERLLHVLDYMAKFEGIDRFRRFRPTVPVKGNAQLWWRFAADCVCLTVREARERRRLRWERVVAFRDFGREYVPLHKRRQGAQWLPPLTEAERRHVLELESHASLEDIIWWRKLAYTELRVDELQHETQRKLVEQRIPRRQTWGEWGWSWAGYGSGAAEGESALLPAVEPGAWSEQQRRQLAVELGFDDADQGADETEEPAAPASYVEHVIQVHIGAGKVELLERAAGAARPLAGVLLSDFQFRAALRRDGMRLVTSLGGLGVSDQRPEAPQRCIVQRTVAPQPKQRQSPRADRGLLLVAYERAPGGGGGVTSAIDIALAPLDLVFAPDFAERMARFLRPPPSIASLGGPAAAINSGSSAGRRRLAVMAQRHLGGSCDVVCNLEAPNLIVPFDTVLPGCDSLRVGAADYPCPRGGALVVMLGTLSLNTDTGHIRARAGREAKGAPPAEEDAYDRHFCDMRSMRALVADDAAAFTGWWQKNGTVTGCPCATHTMIDPFDVRTELHRLLPHAAPWSRGAALVVRPTLPACQMVLSRQGVALALRLAADLAEAAGRLSPEVPVRLPRGDPCGALDAGRHALDSAHPCRVALRLDSSLPAAGAPLAPPASPVSPADLPVSPRDRPASAGSGLSAALSWPTTDGVAALRQGQLLLYLPPEGAEAQDAPPAGAAEEAEEAGEGSSAGLHLALRHVLDLRTSPGRLYCEGSCLVVALPQAYGPPKLAVLHLASAGRLRALYESLHAVVSAARERSNSGGEDLGFEEAEVGDSVRVVAEPAASPKAVPPEAVAAAASSGAAAPRCCGVVVGKTADTIRVRWCSEDDGGPATPAGCSGEAEMTRGWWEAGGAPVRDIDRDRERTQLRLEFQMATLRVALSDSHDGGRATFASALFTGFQASLDLRAHDQRARLRLNALELREAAPTTDGGALLVSSHGDAPWPGASHSPQMSRPPSGSPVSEDADWLVAPEGGGGPREALIDIAYSNCGDQSPLYRRDGPDMRVQLNAATLNAVVCPTLARTVELAWDLLGVQRLSEEGRPRVHCAAPLHLQPVRAPLAADPSRVGMQTTARMRALRLRCSEEISPGEFQDFFLVAVRNARFDVSQSPEAVLVVGSLGDVVAEEVAEQGPREILGVADPGRGSLVSFRYHSPTGPPADALAGGEPYIAATVGASLKQIRGSFHFPLFLRLLHWSTAGHVVSRLQRVAGRRPAAIAAGQPPAPLPPPRDTPPGVVDLDLSLENPLVALAPHPGSVRRLEAALGSVRVRLGIQRGECGGAEQLNTVEFRSMSVAAVHGDGQPARDIAAGLDVTLNTTTVLVNPKGVLPAQSVDIALGDISMEVDEADWGLMMQIAAHNLLGSFRPPLLAPAGSPAEPAERSPRPAAAAAAVKGKLSVHARRLCVGLHGPADCAAARPPAFGELLAEGMQMRRSDNADGTSELLASLEALSVTDVARETPRPLVSCWGGGGGEQPAPDDERLIEVSLRTAESTQHLRLCVGRPCLHADPIAIFRVQDLLACPEAAAAVAHILAQGRQTASAAVATPVPAMTVANVALREMTLVGLESGAESPLFSLSASDVKVDSELAEGGRMRVAVRLGDFRLNAFEEGAQVEAMGLAQEGDSRRSLVEVAFERGHETAPGFKQYARVRLHALRAILLPGFWQRVGHWASQGPLRDLAMIGTARAERLARDIAASADLVQLDLEWQGPRLVFPLRCGAAEHLTAVLGGMHLRNELLPRAEDSAELEEVFQCELLKVRLFHRGDALGRGGELQAEEFDIVRDVDVTATLSRPLLQGGAPDPAALALARVQVGMVKVHLSDAQLRLIRRIARAHPAPAPPRDSPHPPRSPRRPPGPSPEGSPVQASPHQPAGGGVAVDATFAGLQLVLSSEGATATHADPPGDGVLCGAPLARLDMHYVSLAASPGGSFRATLDRITVTDLTPGTPVEMRDVLATVLPSELGGESAPGAAGREESPKCLQIVVEGGPDGGSDAEVYVWKLRLLLASEFLTRLHAYAASTGAPEEAPGEAAAPPLAAPPAAAARPDAPRPPAAARRLRARLDAFSVSMLDGWSTLLDLTVDATELSGELIAGGGYDVSGRLGGVTLADRSTPGTLYTEVLAASGDAAGADLIEFRLATLGAPEGYDKLLEVTMRSLTIVYLPVFLGRVQRFLRDGGIEWILHMAAEGADQAARAAAETAAHAAHRRRPLPVCVHGVVHNPIVLLPVEATGEAAVVADLGEIRMANEADSTAERVRITVSDMALTTRRKDTRRHQVLRGASLELGITRQLQEPAGGGPEPDIAVRAQLTGTEATATADDWTTLLAAAVAQTRSAPPPLPPGAGRQLQPSPLPLPDSAPPAPAAGPGRQFTQTVAVTASAPVVGLTLCTADGLPFAAFRMRDIVAQHSSSGAGGGSGGGEGDAGAGSTSSFALHGIELQHIWRKGGRSYCRDLCLTPAADPAAAQPQAPCVRAQVTHKPDGAGGEHTHAAVVLQLPQLLCVAPLLAQLHGFFVLPYREVLCGDTALQPAEAISITADLAVGEDIFLSPHRVLHVRGSRRNCVEIRGSGEGADSRPCIHLVRDCSDRRRLVVIDSGMALRFVDVTVKIYGEGGLDEYVDAGEGSYTCLVGESIVENVLSGAEGPGGGAAVLPFAGVHPRPGGPGAGGCARSRLSLSVECGFGVGIAAETGAGGDQRCIMLSGAVNTQYESEATLTAPPTHRLTVMLTDLAAVHLAVATPRLYGPGELGGGGAAAGSGPVLNAAHLLEPTNVEVQGTTQQTQGSLPSLKVQTTFSAVRLRICLGDIETITHFLRTLPGAAGAADPGNVAAAPGEVPIIPEDQQQEWEVKFNSALLSATLVDDSMGTPQQLFDLSLDRPNLNVKGAGGLPRQAEGVVSVAAGHYNPDVCEWEPLVEWTTVEVRSVTAQAGLRHAAAGRGDSSRMPRALIRDIQVILAQHVLVNITPVLIRSLSRTAALYSHFAGGAPRAALRARSLYLLRNETGREIRFSAGDGLVTSVAASCEVSFDAAPVSDKQPPVAYVAVVFNAEQAKRIGPPPGPNSAEGLRSGEWIPAPIGRVGKHRAGEGFIVEIDNDQGRKVVRFRTPVVIESHLGEPLHVEGVGVVLGKQGGENSPPGRVSVPHDRLGKSEGFRIRPANGPYSEARLGYLFCNLVHVPPKWCNYFVRCRHDPAKEKQPQQQQYGVRAAALPRRDFCFTCTLEKDPAVGDVRLVLHPLFVLENRLPCRLRFTLGATDTRLAPDPLASAELDGFGGCARVTGCPERWPHCSLSLTAACSVGHYSLESDKAAVWVGPPTVVAPTAARNPPEGAPAPDLSTRSRAVVLQTCDTRDSGWGRLSLVVHLAYGPRGSVTAYSPLWVLNATEYTLEVAPRGERDGTLIPAAKQGQSPTPWPVSPEEGAAQLAFRCGDGVDWSDPLDVSAMMPGPSVVVPCPKLPGMFRHLGIGVETLTWPNVLHGSACTRIIRVAPRWLFVNATHLELSLRMVVHQGSRPGLALRPGESKECSASGTSEGSVIEVRYGDDPYIHNRFSKAFPVGEVGDVHLRLNYDLKAAGEGVHRPGIGCFAGPTAPDGSTEYFRVLRACIQEQGAQLTVTFRPCDKPTFVIENRSAFVVTLVQRGVHPVVPRNLPPRTTVPYALDDPFQPPEVELRLHTARGHLVGTRWVKLDRLTKEGDKMRIRGSHAQWVWLRVRHSPAALSTVLSLTEEHYINRRTFHSPGTTFARAVLRSLGVSLSVPRQGVEVALMTFRGVGMQLSCQELEVAADLQIEDFQVDDMSEHSPQFPVALKRRDPPPPEGRAPRFLELEVLRSMQSHDVLVIRNCRLALVPLELCLCDTFLCRLLGCADEVARLLDQDRSELWDTGRAGAAQFRLRRPSPAADAAAPEPPAEESLWNRKAYVGDLAIEPTSLTVTVTRQEDDPSNPFSFLNADRWWLDYALRSIEKGVLTWERCELTDASERVWVLARRLQMMYWQATRNQLPMLLGSLSFLGNPASTIKGVGEGLWDLVSMPISGAASGDGITGALSGGLSGMFQGGLSLVTKTGAGVAGSVSSLTRSAAKTTSRLSFDPEWMASRQARNRGAPRGVGSRDHVVSGIRDGVLGVVQSPASRFSSDGLSGAMAGVMLATTGLVAKPVTGVLDGVADGLEWLRGVPKHGERARKPRVFRPGGVLADYAASGEGDAAAAAAQQTPPLGSAAPAEVRRAAAAIREWKQGRLTRGELRRAHSVHALAAAAEWDDFRALLSPKEFFDHAHLARDRYLSQECPVRTAQGSRLTPEQQKRVQHLYDTVGVATLAKDPSFRVTPEELAHVTTWDEFRAWMGVQRFYETAHLARDRCLLPTDGFQLL